MVSEAGVALMPREAELLLAAAETATKSQSGLGVEVSAQQSEYGSQWEAESAAGEEEEEAAPPRPVAAPRKDTETHTATS